jgi:N-acetylmuramoyl-L-alanine amidase
MRNERATPDEGILKNTAAPRLESRHTSWGPALAVLFLSALLLAAALLLQAAPASAASPAASFNAAWKDFHALLKDSRRNKYRDQWKRLESRFQDIYTADPSGPTAPKALYFTARTNEELAKRSMLKADFLTAVDYFLRVPAKFPGHSWSDDCLYRAAFIQQEHLNQKTAARETLTRCLKAYPKGDMRRRAEELLTQLGGDVPSAVSRTAKAPAKATVQARDHADEARDAAARDAPKPSVPGATELARVRYQSSDSYTRIVLDITDEVPYRYQILDPVPDKHLPYRLYVDLEGAAVGPAVAGDISIADGILRRVRTGQNKPGTARVVLDFQDFQKYQIFALENPFRLVIDVSAPEDDAKASQVAAASVGGPRRSASSAARSARPAKKPEPYKLPAGSKSQVGDLVEQLGLTVHTIMIDPGHGGKDPGAIGYGKLREKDVNLRFAKVLGAHLKKQGFEVLYTRTDDTFIPLEERTAMANVRKADLFISVHCNAHRDRSMRGFETYYLNLARSKDAVRVAARENAVTTKRISDLQFILTDLMLNSKMKESKDLASSVHDCTVDDIGKHYSFIDHGVRTAPFYVLMGAKMPSILVELGYITNKTEAGRLNSKSYLERQAAALTRGVLAYKRQIERFASL